MNNRLLLLSVFFLSSLLGYSQQQARVTLKDSLIPERRMDQQEKFKAGEYDFPARPRDMWEIGISGGVLQVSGDVKSSPFRGDHFPALAWGLHVRKSLGYVLSLRLEYLMGAAYGQNWQANSGILNNFVLTGKDPDANPNLDYTQNPNGTYVYHNYKTKIRDLSIQGIVNLNNIKFHKKENKVNVYAMFGIGAMIYETFIDQLDANGQMYDYSAIRALGGSDFGDRKDILSALQELYDYEYESKAERHRDDPTMFDMTFKVVPSAGIGVSVKVSDRFSISAEHTAKFTVDDLLDGVRWTERNVFTRDFDTYHYTSLHLNVHLGSKKKSEIPQWWINPLSFAYNEMTNAVPPDMGDDDKDGVLNILDMEPNSPEGSPVDTRGVTLDSDKDGCPDFEDPEPFSTPERAIENCVNIGPAPLDEPAVRQIVQEMMGSAPLGMGSGAADWYLPMIHFDLDKDVIKPEFYGELKHVADVMKKYSALKVEVMGHTDVRNSDDYNLDLSRRRAANAIRHIVDKYGIDESRFIMRFEGENQVLIPDARRDAEHYMNRRVEFKASEN